MRPSSVMVVDDDKDQTILYSLFLARFGFDSIPFTDPIIALKHYEQHSKRYGLVLLDWIMPEINGISLAKKLRDYNLEVKIVLITAYFVGDTITKDKLKEIGIMDIIQKPIVFSEFKRRMILHLC